MNPAVGLCGDELAGQPPQVVGDAAGSAGGEDSVRADQRHRAVADAADGGFDQSVADDAGRLERGRRLGVGGYQYVAARPQQLVQPRWSVRRADRDVRYTLAGPRSPPATATVGQDERAPGG